MTDNENKKALECCLIRAEFTWCENRGVCPYFDKGETYSECKKLLFKDTINLINRQKAENKKWQGGYMTQKQEIANLEIELKAMQGAANSYKAENERLNAKLKSVYKELERIALMTVETDRKELVGEDK